MRILAILIAGSLVVAVIAAERRAATPQWNAAEPRAVFFDDAFREALTGTRPPHLSPLSETAPPATAGTDAPGANPQQPANANWAKWIDSENLEDEVKRVSLSLETVVTTPAHFASKGHQAARRDFSRLAVLFGAIDEYEQPVRWKAEAAYARDQFARIAAIAKVGSTQAYEAAKSGKEELRGLVRGEPMSDRPERQGVTWTELVDRPVLMQLMEQEFREHVGPSTANSNVFQTDRKQLAHHAQILAMLTHVLTRPSMQDADDPDYVALCETMLTASRAIVDGVNDNQYNATRQAAAEITRACDACHENYRG